MRDSSDIANTHENLRILTIISYGITEIDRQWQKVIEKWMLQETGFERVSGVSLRFTNRDKEGRIVMLVAKVTDEIIMGGIPDIMREIAESTTKRFEVHKVGV